VRSRALTLRAIALLAAGAAAIHQLRYAIGYGNEATRELASTGHAYLAFVLPFVAALAGVALARMLRVPFTPPPGERVSLRRLWAAAFAVLVGIFIAQELLEGSLAAGHPAGLEGVFGSGGWTAVVLAAPTALLIALGLRGDEALGTVVLARLRAPGLPIAPLRLSPRPDPHPSRLLARVLPARGPPSPYAV
jgi:hypothetical protein